MPVSIITSSPARVSEVHLISIRTKEDVAKMASHERAFVFLWVNWAIHARHSQRVVEAVVEDWQNRQPELPASAYVADVSHQSGELWDALADWLEREGRPAGHLMMSGVGPLIWVRNGRVAAHAFPNQVGREKLAAVCQSIWA